MLYALLCFLAFTPWTTVAVVSAVHFPSSNVLQNLPTQKLTPSEKEDFHARIVRYENLAYIARRLDDMGVLELLTTRGEDSTESRIPNPGRRHLCERKVASLCGAPCNARYENPCSNGWLPTLTDAQLIDYCCPRGDSNPKRII